MYIFNLLFMSSWTDWWDHCEWSAMLVGRGSIKMFDHSHAILTSTHSCRIWNQFQTALHQARRPLTQGRNFDLDCLGINELLKDGHFVGRIHILNWDPVTHYSSTRMPPWTKGQPVPRWDAEIVHIWMNDSRPINMSNWSSKLNYH